MNVRYKYLVFKRNEKYFLNYALKKSGISTNLFKAENA